MAGSEDLFKAIKATDVGRVKEMLGANPSLASVKHASGLSPVLAGLYSGNLEIAQAILAANPDLDVFDSAALGRTELVAKAIAEEPALGHAWSKDGYTPLHLAAFFGRVDTVAMLLATADSQINVPSRNELKVTPLHSSASTDQFDVVARLLANGAEVNAREGDGATPLHHAARLGDTRLIRLIRQFGADLKAKDNAGKTPLDFAGGRADVVTALS